MKKFIIVLLIAILITFNQNNSFAQKNDLEETNSGIFVKTGILSTSLVDINNNTAQINDKFKIRLIEKISSSPWGCMPPNTIFEGHLIEIKKPKKLPKRDGVIRIAMDKAYKPDGKIISFEHYQYEFSLMSPYNKNLDEQIIERAPIALILQGVTVPLRTSGNYDFGTIYAIATGAAAALGSASGYIDPDAWNSRKGTSINRGINATAIGTIKGIFQKGNDVSIAKCEYLLINMEKLSITRIPDKILAQIVKSKLRD